ncbi:Serine/threonine-protein kinase GRIK1 [Cyberlindnera fabianii]|uniref:Serine/threonine-protein kinase GRIK1 n=1 Tax=Cyberlindnera fabianii TaxID=36022 RepID=A0A1V2LE29_CYBFA|nr:Serine/threonine-protein kinase GRIK1 [Cyberlindnera fabianii]
MIPLHVSQRCIVSRTTRVIDGVERTVAVKKYFRKALRRQAMKTGLTDTEIVRRELDMMNSVTHSSIVSGLGIIETPTAIELIMEDGGDALVSKRTYSTEFTKRCLADVSSALSALHANNIVHMDIKPENIVFSGERAKICDFGSALKIQPHGKLPKFPQTTPAFSSPELCLMSLNATAVSTMASAKPLDMWALGVTLYSMVFGRMPFHCEENDDLQSCYASIIGDEIVLEECDYDLQQCITGLLERDPSRRLTAAQVHKLIS